MKRTKLIIISTFISLATLLILNFTIDYFKKDSFKEVYVLNKNKIEGEEITKEDIVLTSIKEIKKEELFENFEFKTGYAAKTNLEKGQILNKNMLNIKGDSNINNKDLEIIAIPIESASDILGYQIKRGDRINIYATAKTKDITNLYSDEKKTYSSLQENSYTTFKVVENAQVIELIDDTGKRVSDGKCTEIIIKIEIKKVEQYINLKQFAKFNVTKEGSL